MTAIRPAQPAGEPPRTAQPRTAQPPSAPAATTPQPPGAGPAGRSGGNTSLALLIGALALLPWLFTAVAQPSFAVQLSLGVGSVLLVVTAALLVVAEVHGDFGIVRWRIGSWYLLWSALIFGPLSLQWLQDDPSEGLSWISRIDRSSVIGALGVVCAAYGCWALGYRCGFPRAVVGAVTAAKVAVLGGSRSVLRGPAMPWLVYGVGLLGFLLNYLQTGRYGYVGADPTSMVSNPMATTQLLYVVSQMTLIGLGGAAYRAFDPRIRGGRATLWTLFAVEISMGMLRGSKEAFFMATLALLIPYGAVRGRLPWRLLAASLVLLFVVAVPFNAAYREAVRQRGATGELRSASLTAAFAAAPEILSSALNSTDGRGRSDDVFLFRMRRIDSVAIVWQLTPSRVSYLDPVRFLRAPFVGMIPRAIWPDKPVETPGWTFAQVYLGQPASVFSAYAVTPIGDLYRSGGWLVLLPGMLLMGMGYRLFDGLFRTGSDPRAFCFIIVFFPLAIKSESDYYSMLTSLPAGLVAGALGAWLMCRPLRDRRTPARAPDPAGSAPLIRDSAGGARHAARGSVVDGEAVTARRTPVGTEMS
ncbi:hypothetical protein [Plantactinospora sp. KBS50]|uniref:hypothetical protein n=1 Tax=Plantactinospora sp. KBS50 TaxID=2024580 RepID=UPI000BAACFAB|nr:hypothetical protein [Plantactinospora sp. KBS50]ASW54501.1 hypothetical protein CIK06_10355 [Plantactinospora sp. KBS50]